VLLSLRNDNAKNAVLHRSLDSILINANREAEAALEFADGAFRNPVSGLRLLGLVVGGLGLGVSDLGAGGTLFTCVFDGGFVGFVVMLTAFSDGASGSGSLDISGGRSTRGVGALSATFDGQGLGVAELDLNVLLLDTGKFAVELVGVLEFLDIELGGEGLQESTVVVAAIGSCRVAAVVLEVIEQAEERSEGGGWVVGDE